MKPNVERYELKGLCVTCNHAGFCLELARETGPIWHCEQFDDSVPATSRLDASAGTATPEEGARRTSTAQSAKPAPDMVPPGLCANCKNLPTCCFPKSEAGVWHCEEYL
jgi:hypothetical protein